MQRIIILLLSSFLACVICNLTLYQIDEEQLQGLYADNTTNAGIRFRSGKNSIEIHTLAGSTLVSSIHDTTTKIITSIIGGKGFISYNGEDIAVTVNTVIKARAMASSGEMIDLFNGLTQQRNEYVSEQMRQGISYLMQEKDMLIKACQALEAKGINGKDYPIALLLYKFTLQLDSLRNFNCNDKSNRLTRFGVTDDGDDCLEYCPPCPDQECLGMCGYGCSCWKMVCGDCCYHLGCYDHDVCCREKFFRTRCLLPFGFECEENYYCE